MNLNQKNERSRQYRAYKINQRKLAKRRKLRRIKVLCMAGICAALLLCVTVIFNQLGNTLAISAQKEADRTITKAAARETETVDAVAPSIDRIPVDTSVWNLQLVNSFNSLSENSDITLKSLTNGQTVDERIYQSLMDMLSAGEKEALSFIVCSGYRSIDEQTFLFNKKIKTLQAEGYSYDDAYNLTKQVVAVPGTSEHILGLAVDIVASDYQILDQQQAETPEYQWLVENCYKYGFILRYPSDKQEVTQILYEPWHFRYVGIEAATIIMDENITLEEYLNQ